MMLLEGLLGVLTASAAIIAVKTVVLEYGAWRARRDLAAKRVLDALADDGRGNKSLYDAMLKDLYGQYIGKKMTQQIMPLWKLHVTRPLEQPLKQVMVPLPLPCWLRQ